MLVRYPWLLGSIVFGSLLLSFTATAYPLFISATQTNLAKASLTSPLVTTYGAGVEYRVTNLNFANTYFPLDQIRKHFAARIASEPLLGPTTESVLGPAVSVSAGGRTASAGSRLFAATDAMRHVRIVETDGGPGVWISQLTADDIGVGPGDSVALSFEGRPPVDVPVSTVYRSLYTEPRAPYWYRWQFDIYKRCRYGEDCEPPPPFILVREPQLIALSKELGSRDATFAWEAPVRDADTFTLDKAFALERFTQRLTHDVGDAHGLGRFFHCCNGTLYATGNTTTLSSSMLSVIEDTAKKIAPVQAPGRVLEIAAMIVALTVLAIAGWFTAAGRQVEENLLAARGTSPSVVLLKSCLETVLPCLAGVAAGLGLAFLLIDVVRPSGLVGSGALRGVVPTAALSIAASVLLLAGASTVSYVRTGRGLGRGLGSLRRVPWELGLIVLTVYLFGRLISGGGFVVDPVLHVRKPSPLMLAFPLVALGGFAIVGARLFLFSMRQLRARDQGASSGYLAVRRLTSAPGLTVLLVAASVVCLGLFVQAQVVTRSLETTVEAKAKLFVGSDVQAQVADTSPLPDPFPLPVTKVTQVVDAGTLPNGGSFDLLAVDPSTIERAAYWNPAFSDLSMGQIARALSEPGGSPPILMAGASAVAPRSISLEGTTVPVRTIGAASAFPGITSLRPLVVISQDALGRAYPGTSVLLGSPKATSALWVKGSATVAERAIRTLPYPTFLTITASHVEDIPEFHATIYTFLVLDALGLVAAFLVFAGILMYLQARFRSQVVSFGLSLRMGMTERAHRRAVFIEVASMLVFAYAVGVALAVGTSLLLVPRLDPLPGIPPGAPLFVSPMWVLVAGLIGVVAVSWLGGWISDRRARSVELGEVMRLAA